MPLNVHRRSSCGRAAARFLMIAIVGAALTVPLRGQEGPEGPETPLVEKDTKAPDVGARETPDSQDDPADEEPPEATATDMLDTVELEDGIVYRGKVVETGENYIIVEIGGGARKVLKRDVQNVTFARNRRESRRLETDLVVLANGREVRGQVRLLDNGRRVQVRTPSRTTVTFSREEVARILRRDDVLAASTRYYTLDLEQKIRDAISTVLKGDPERVAGAEKLLTESGIFAVDLVMSAREKLDDSDGTAKAVIDRVIRNYRIRELVPTVLAEAEPDSYAILASGTPEKKLSLLRAFLPAFAGDVVDLVVYLVSDPLEDVRIRSLGLEFLRRLQKNRALLDIYNHSSGRLKLAAAIALVRNRVFVAIPTLIDALTMDVEDVREVALEALREATGEDFRFRAGGTAAARAAAVERWRDWWTKKEEELTTVSLVILSNAETESPERRLATDLWRQAYTAWGEQKLPRTEQLLRESLKTDPSFVQAGVSLAVLLYAERQKVEEARVVLRDLAQRMLPTASREERFWIWLELGHVLRLEKDYEDALAAYDEALATRPKDIAATLGKADCHWMLATGSVSDAPADRHKHQQAAVEGFQNARDLIHKTMKGLVAMRSEDLPVVEPLPFERRAYNRSLLEIRTEYETKLVDLSLQLAQGWALLGNRKKAVLALREGLDTLELTPDLPEARTLEAELRSYLGLQYEALDRPDMALTEYQRVLRSLDPQNEMSKRGIERLRTEVELGAPGAG